MQNKSIIIPSYTLNIVRATKSMRVEEKPLSSEPAPDEVLIRMIASPINPSDISFLQGRYAVDKPLPAIPGFEATGYVIKAGSRAAKLLNRKVSCFTRHNLWGTWSEYFITNADDCIPLLDGVPDDQAACLSINPFTAYGLIQEVRKSGSNAVVLNAAGSQVAGLLRQIAKSEKINTINIIRKLELKELLEKEGETRILVQEEDLFEDKLREMTEDLSAHIALDAVGGDMAGTLLNNLPDDSKVIVYGGLSGKPIGNADPLQVIFHKKSIIGWDLNQWLDSKDPDEFRSISEDIQQKIIEGKLHTKIHTKYPLEKYEEALYQYIKQMSMGKILLCTS